jgi:phage gp29-like protein
MTVVADFIFLGQDRVGSFALSSDKTNLFSLALGAWLKDIASVMNKTPISKLMTLNGIPSNLWPTIKPGDLEKEDVMKFIDSIYKLVSVGAMIPDEDIDAKARELLDLPIKVAKGNL